MQGPELALREHFWCQGLCKAIYKHDLTDSLLLLSDGASKVTPILHKWKLSFQEVKAPAQAYLGQYMEPKSGLGRFPGERNGYPFQYSCLENPMDRGAWQATVHVVARVRHD